MKRLVLVPVILFAVIGFGCGEMTPQSSPSNADPGANSVTNVTTNVSGNPIPNQNSSANAMADSAPTKSTGNSNKPAANSVGNSPKINAKATGPQTESPVKPANIEKKDEGLFSFPPPRVTSSMLINTSKWRGEGGETSFGSVADKLAAGLKNAGYSPEKYSFFWNDADEFAIVVKMERIDIEGAPMPGNERWDDSQQFPRAGLTDYLRYLIKGKKVYYRVFAFVVTKKNYNFYKNSPPSFDVAKEWMNKGFAVLGGDEPAEAAPNSSVPNRPFTEKYHCYALLYLFVNHTSLDTAKSVDTLEGVEEGLKSGLNEEVHTHLCRTNIIFGDCK